MPLRLEEFQQPTLTGYVQNVPTERQYPLKALMPTENSFDINFAYNVINGQYAKAASITGWNASAPLRDAKSMEKAFGQVAKVQHGFRLDETQLLQYNRPRSAEESSAVVNAIYTSTDDLTQGVDDIEEFMRAQVIYTGKLKYEDKENDIYIDVDFGIPAENLLPTTTAWTSTSTATPLADLQAAVTQFKKQNQRRKPVVMHMTSATESSLLQNEQIRTQAYGMNGGGRLMTSADVQNVFSALGLPPYAINDDVIVVGDEEVQLLDDEKVVLIGAEVGKTILGPTVENNFTPGKFAVPTVKTNPPEQSVVVGEAVFPALQRPQSIVIMSV